MYYVIRDRDNPQLESWLIAPLSKSPRLYLRNEYEGSWIHGDVFEDFPTEPMQFLLLSDEKLGLIVTTNRLTLIHETLCQFLEIHADGEFYSHRIEILEPKTKRIVTNEYFFIKPYKKVDFFRDPPPHETSVYRLGTSSGDVCFTEKLCEILEEEGFDGLLFRSI